MTPRKVDTTTFPRTDKGNAELLAALFKDQLKFNCTKQKWMIWRGHWWEEDKKGEVIHFASAGASERFNQLPKQLNKEAKAAKKWALDSQSKYHLKAALELAQSEPEFVSIESEWDSNHWLFAVENGVIDLRTGVFSSGVPAQLISLHAPIVYDPAATSPVFQKFIESVWRGNEETTAYVQKSLGYSITGSTDEQCLFMCYGSGQNGKSTLLTLMLQLLGDSESNGYAEKMDLAALEGKKQNTLSPDIARLPGKRIALASETNTSSQFNEAKVKELTGELKITARSLYKDPFTFTVQSKFWLTMNHLPQVIDNSNGFWRRMRVIPFLRNFTEAEKDPTLLNKLLQEKAGILNWLIEGVAKWRADGLVPPKEVEDLTAEYRRNNDSIGEFVNDFCTLNQDQAIEVQTLWNQFAKWARESGLKDIINKGIFNKYLEDKGLLRKRHGKKGIWHWIGITLSVSDLEESDAPKVVVQ